MKNEFFSDVWEGIKAILIVCITVLILTLLINFIVWLSTDYEYHKYYSLTCNGELKVEVEGIAPHEGRPPSVYFSREGSSYIIIDKDGNRSTYTPLEGEYCEVKKEVNRLLVED